MTRSELIRQITADYIEDIKMNPPAPADIQTQLLAKTNMAIDAENAGKPRNEQWRKNADLELSQISQIMLALYPIICVTCTGEHSDPAYDLLAVYVPEGENMGIYDTNEVTFRRIAKSYNRSLKQKDCEEIIADLKDNAPRRRRCQDGDLIPVEIACKL